MQFCNMSRNIEQKVHFEGTCFDTAYIQYFTVNSFAALLSDIDIANVCSCLPEMVSFQTKTDYI